MTVERFQIGQRLVWVDPSTGQPKEGTGAHATVTRVDETFVWLRSPGIPWSDDYKIERVRDQLAFVEWSTPDEIDDLATENAEDKARIDAALAEEPTTDGAATWEPVNLGPILDGTVTRHMPTVGMCDDGKTGLFYPGKVNGIAGPSTGGKSWTADVVAAQVLEGGVVVFIDLEDDATGVVGRLRELGVDPDDIRERFVYIHPDESYSIVAQEKLLGLIAERDARLVIIDSTGEAMALNNVKPNDDDDVARWFRYFPGRVAAHGPTVLILDHVVKSGEGGLYPIGSQRKRAAISGAQYMQDIVKPFSRTEDGRARLVCAKDRQGTYRNKQHVADLVVEHTVLGLRMTLHAAPSEEADAPDLVNLADVALMEKVSRFIEDADAPLSTNNIRHASALGAKTDRIKDALARLVADGYVSQSSGPRNSLLHASVRPFRAYPNDRTPTGPRPDPGPVRASGPRTPDLRSGSTHTLDATTSVEVARGPLATPEEDVPVEDPPGNEGRSCSSCGAPLHWMRAEYGKDICAACEKKEGM